MSLKPSILIAEDDSNFGMVLKSYLAINDFEVTLLPTGTEALSFFKRKKYRSGNTRNQWFCGDCTKYRSGRRHL